MYYYCDKIYGKWNHIKTNGILYVEIENKIYLLNLSEAGIASKVSK